MAPRRRLLRGGSSGTLAGVPRRLWSRRLQQEEPVLGSSHEEQNQNPHLDASFDDHDEENEEIPITEDRQHLGQNATLPPLPPHPPMQPPRGPIGLRLGPRQNSPALNVPEGQQHRRTPEAHIENLTVARERKLFEPGVNYNLSLVLWGNNVAPPPRVEDLLRNYLVTGRGRELLQQYEEERRAAQPGGGT